MDAYDYKARLAPITVIGTPIFALGIALLGAGAWRTGIGVLVALSGLHFLFMQFVRDRGFVRQDQLFEDWGGSPTVQLLRWSGAANAILVEHRHQEVTRATGISLPTSEEETSNPMHADQRYEAAIAILRDRTRTTDFSLVSKHNAAYGFRRNLFGCKPIGIAIALGTTVAGMGITLSPLGDSAHFAQGWIIAASAFSIIWALMWAVGVTAEFVRHAADQYANSLIEAAGRIQSV